MFDEWSDLPEDPRLLTYRGRYLHVDEATVELAGLNKLAPGTEVSVLDYAGGVRPYGSPTAHDLHERLTSLGLDPKITVCDINIPDDLIPAKTDVVYTRSVDSTKGEFDVVRLLWVVGHLLGDDYAAVRQQATRRLRDGGLFVCVQLLAVPDKLHGTDQMIGCPAMIKVMQRRGNQLIPVALLPAPLHPWPGWTPTHPDWVAQRWEKIIPSYRSWRDRAVRGLVPLRRVINRKGFEIALRVLSTLTPAALDNEDIGLLLRDNGLREGAQTWDPSATLSAAAADVPRHFLRGLRAQGQELG